MKTTRFITSLFAAGLLAAQAHADVLPPVQDSTSSAGKLTLATGRATTLPITGTRKAFVLFNINSLPVDVQPADIMDARLRIYLVTAVRPGDIAVHAVTGAWDEKTTALEPAVSGSTVATFPMGMVVAKKFVEVDVTSTVQAWRSGALANNGFALEAGGITSVALGAKEGPGSGYPCELEVQVDRSIAGGFSGALVGDVSGPQGLTVVASVGGSTAAQIHTAEALVSAATNLNTSGTLVRRDDTGVSLPFFRAVTSQNGPSFQSANIVAGSTANIIANGITGVVIAGGGATNGFPQAINANYASIGGGYSNTIGVNGGQSVIAGGVGNTVNASNGTIAGGQSNTVSGQGGTVGGGQSNTASGASSMIPGGNANTASGSTSFAAGNRAKAVTNGSFVWGDSTNADVSSTANDQFVVRANGGLVLNTVADMALNATNGVTLSASAGSGISVPIGTLYKDNSVVAWGRVLSSSLDASFNVKSFVRNSAGNYTITLNPAFSVPDTLIPSVTVSYTGAQPTTAAAIRIASINQGLSNSAFTVYINNGTFAAADADFTFVVTGR